MKCEDLIELRERATEENRRHQNIQVTLVSRWNATLTFVIDDRLMEQWRSAFAKEGIPYVMLCLTPGPTEKVPS